MNDRMRSVGGRLAMAAIIAVIAIVGYYSSAQKNPVTGKTQHVDLSKDQEIAMGLQAVPEMTQQFGGESDDRAATERVRRVGERIVARSAASKGEYKYRFHLLGDHKTINAFALPGGQVFITKALYDKLQTEGQLAGVLGHEIGHVVGRHGAEHIAKQKLAGGLVNAVAVGSDSQDAAQYAQQVAALVNLKYGRGDETAADEFGCQFMSEAGYDPRAMIGVMKILEEASAGSHTPEFFSTHPNPENRIGKIEEVIQKRFPNGVPAGLEK